MAKMTGRISPGVGRPPHTALLYFVFEWSPTYPLEIAGNEQQQAFAKKIGR